MTPMTVQGRNTRGQQARAPKTTSPGDIFSPPQPEPARLDPARRTWTLSRYADVFAALREPTFFQASAKGQNSGADMSVDNSRVNAELQADMNRMSSAEWRAQMESVAQEIINRVARPEPISLTREIIQPWSLAVLLNLSGADQVLADRLRRITDCLLYKREYRDHPTTNGSRSPLLLRKWFSWRRKRAEGELDRILETRQLSISRSMFFGLTQTLPSFLAKSWLALLHHPDQMARLRTEPELMPSAVEELLRYAGIVHTLYRRATRDVSLGDVHIAKDDFIILKLAAANHDPLKFHEPSQLDITRRPIGQLGLGTGQHACVGAVIVRIAVSVVTPIFLAADPTLETSEPIVWTGDSTVRWPVGFCARLRTRPKVGISAADLQNSGIR